MISWTDDAIESLAQIAQYAGYRGPDAGPEIVERLFNRALELDFMPYARRMVPEVGSWRIREAIEAGYRIWYRADDDDVVVILVVFHGAREVPD